MNDTTLKTKVEKAVEQKILDRDAFTTADISHPLIAEDASIRHRQVRALIEEIVGRGDLNDGMFTSSPITVYPKPNTAVTARLFHPDDPTFDPATYVATHQKLNRNQSSPAASITHGYDMTDEDGDNGSNDGVTHVATTVSGAPVTKQCYIQPKQGSLNIPRIVVKGAGFNTGDKIAVSGRAGAIRIDRADNGSQEVDKEGRIRLHGKNITGKSAMSKPHLSSGTCTAIVVSPKGFDAYIEIQ